MSWQLTPCWTFLILAGIILIDWFRAEKKVFAALPQFQGAPLFGQWGLKLLRWFVLSHFISTVSNSCTIMQYFVLVSSVCNLSPSVWTLVEWCLWVKKSCVEEQWGAAVELKVRYSRHSEHYGGSSGGWLVTTRPKEGELPGESVAKEFSLQETDSDSCPLTKGGGAHLYFCIYGVYVFSTFFIHSERPLQCIVIPVNPCYHSPPDLLLQRAGSCIFHFRNYTIHPLFLLFMLLEAYLPILSHLCKWCFTFSRLHNSLYAAWLPLNIAHII